MIPMYVKVCYTIFKIKIVKGNTKMNQNGFLTIDLHGCNQYQAKIKLDHTFRRAGTGVYQIRVIHGHNNGTVLRELTHSYQNNPKVKRMLPGDGETAFILREL